MDPGRLDVTSCVGELCARRPARGRMRDRGLAPTAFKMSPLPGLNSHKLFDESSLLPELNSHKLFGESSLLHSGCDTWG